MNKTSIKGLLEFYHEKIIEEVYSKALNDSIFMKNPSEMDLEKYMDFVFTLPQEIYNHNKDKIDGIIIIIDEFR